ncbi:hypothetical protein ACWHA1_11150 [Streptomyces decoyicus]
MTATYRPDQLGGLPLDRFHAALVAEGATEFDRPDSTQEGAHSHHQVARLAP